MPAEGSPFFPAVRVESQGRDRLDGENHFLRNRCVRLSLPLSLTPFHFPHYPHLVPCPTCHNTAQSNTAISSSDTNHTLPFLSLSSLSPLSPAAAADALLGEGESSANPGAAGDWTRMSFHDAGQFFLNGGGCTS
jgi:hypothetical protein